jgi:hypothetical protein
MARTLFVPEVVPSATPPDDYQRIQSSPAEFGGLIGQATEKGGAQIHQLGGEVLNVYDQLASTQAFTDYQHAVTDLMYGDPAKGQKGYFAMTGQEAMDALPGIRKQMDELVGNIKGGLKTNTSQVDFERASRRLQSLMLERAGSHYDQQSKVWGISVSDGSMAATERGTANSYNDDEFFKHSREEMRGDAVKKAQLLGHDPMGAIADADSRLVQARLNGALAQRDYATADQIYKQYGNLLDDKARPAYQNHIHSGLNGAEGDALANGALGLGPMPSAKTGQSPKSSGWGPLATPAIDEFKKAGASPAFIQAAMANGLGEGGFKDPWQKARGDEESYGHWQFNRNGELPAYLANEGKDNPQDTRAQARFLVRRMEELSPGITKTDDPKAATDAIATQFEKYTGAAPGQRYGQLSDAQRHMADGTSNVEVWGDSLGVGLRGQLKSAGYAHGGDTPQTILDNIQKQPPERWQGMTVVLPSGSNGDQMPIVEDTIKYLKDHGANVVAVGYGPKFPEKNTQLQAIAGRQQVPVIAAEGVGAGEGIHPSPQGYQAMAQKIGAAVQNIPTLSTPAAPPQQTQAAPPNRSGLPPLSEVWDRVWNTPGYSEEARSHAWAKATTRYNAFEADATRAERIQTQQQKQAMEHRENEVWADVYSPAPQISAQQIAVDPAFNGNPERRKQMIELINNPPGSGVPAAQSYQAALSLLDRIRRPDGDAQKISDMAPLYDAAIQGKLNKSDFEFVKKEFTDIRTPGGEALKDLKTDFLKKMSPSINRSNPLFGKVIPIGEAKAYEFDRFVAHKIEAKRAAGQDPTELFEPTSPAYLGKPEILSRFQPTMQEEMQSMRDWMTAGTGGAKSTATPSPGPRVAAPPPAPNAAATRQPGESIGDYMKRVGSVFVPPAPQPSAPVR